MITDKIINEFVLFLINIENELCEIYINGQTNKDTLKNKIDEFLNYMDSINDFEKNKLSFKNNSDIILNDQPINSSIYNAWLMFSKGFFITVVFPFLSELKELSNTAIDNVKRFSENAPIQDNLKSYIYFIISSFYSDSSPMEAYNYGIKAFEISRNFASSFNLNYVYNPDLLNENVSDICPICASHNTVPYKTIEQFKIRNLGSNFSPYKLWYKCNDCTNLFAYNFPISDMATINGHYTTSSNKIYEEVRFPLRIYSDIFNKCREYTHGNKYLEIGIGNGEMLAAAMEMNYDVTAIEICRPDSEKVSLMLGIDVINDDFITAKINKKFDIIIMGDVLEHISKPKEALIKARDMLNENGVLWVSTPNYMSAFSRLYKDKDPMWNQKNHFTYFCYNGLEKILNELDLIVKTYDISNRYNGSMELYIQKK